MSFLDIVSKFNQQADSHSKSQSLNPFSEKFEQSRSPSPRFSREEYGKPVAGSKTDLRGRKAKSHICREILELCTVIHDVGTYNAKKKDANDRDSGEDDDGTVIVSFGELFQIYTAISDKVVGLLIAAKRRGFVFFDREILFQRRDDDVLIALMKPIAEISKQLKEEIGLTIVAPQPDVRQNSTVGRQEKRVETTPTDREQTKCNGACNGVVVEGSVNNVVEISEVVGDVTVVDVKNDKIETTDNDDETDARETDGSDRVTGQSEQNSNIEIIDESSSKDDCVTINQ